MVHSEILEDYFVKISQNYGITKLDFDENKVQLDDKFIRNMIFMSDDFDHEFDNLLEHCKILYDKIERGFSLKIKRDINNNYMVLLT